MSPFRSDIRRGDLYWLNWSPGRGSEQSGRRPALIIAADASNRNERYPLIIVATLSTVQREILTHIVLEPDAENGLSQRSSIKCEQLMTVDKDRLEDRIGRISTTDLSRVDSALKRALSLR